ncbi:hypothetical protein HZY86_03840 [Aerococcaceae bacterium DSM 111020]|nr:hypothetical protein [Aerococcaceae bacterium DSM 111020]
MEIPFNHVPFQRTLNKINQLSNQFIDTFTLPDFTMDHDQYLMPRSQVEQILHDHYVSTDLVSISFEYYDQDVLKRGELIAQVLSPVQMNQTIALQPEQTNYSIYLPLDQILTVSSC